MSRIRRLVIIPLACVVLSAVVACQDSVSIPVPDDLAGTTNARLLEVVEETRRGVEEDPRSALAWVRLGHAYLAHKWDTEAAECYRRAIELEPEDYRWHYYLGQSLFAVDDQQAADAFARAIELGGEYPPALFYLGEVLTSLGRVDEAQREFERLNEILPDSPHVLLSLGKLAFSARRLEEARTLLERAVAIAPEFSEAHAGLAKVCLGLGDREAATRHAELARRRSRVPPLPDFLWDGVQMLSVGPGGYFARAELFFGAGQFERGIAEMEKLVADGQDDPEVWLYYASVMFDKRQYDRAVNGLQRTLKFSTGAWTLPPRKLVWTHMMLGASFARLGDTESAERHLRRAVELDPDSNEARKELAAFYIAQGRTREANDLLERAGSSGSQEP